MYKGVRAVKAGNIVELGGIFHRVTSVAQGGGGNKNKTTVVTFRHKGKNICLKFLGNPKVKFLTC